MINKLIGRIKKLWTTINGRKRNIGIFILLVGMGLKAFDLTTEEVGEFIKTLGIAIGGLGWGHSVLKDKKTTGLIKNKLNIKK